VDGLCVTLGGGMPVDINDILHVLAHELRTPVGIVQGYVRLLLDNRLPQEADRRRALEQMQKALGRLGDLSNETTALASWYDQGHVDHTRVGARALVDRVAGAAYESPVTVDAGNVSDAVTVRTLDAGMLANALVNIVRATARESRGEPCAVAARLHDGRFEMLTGSAELLTALRAGPMAPGAGPIALERGGLGLALVQAAIVLDAHGAERWTMDNSRQIAGISVPIEEGPHQ
jgi:hypothetical protein